ncbi:MAG: PEGA domain-containing protein [Minisyncoccia bacterium]
MTIKTRRIFFYSLIFIFALAGAYLIASAQGWVLDIKNFRIVKTGSLFLKYIPSNATVSINGETTDASPGILTGGTLISRLVPGEYEIKISETGYRPWEKNLKVREALVTSASQIKLWPEDNKLINVSTSSISDFWLTGAGAVLQLKDKTLNLGDSVLRGRQVILTEPNFSSLISSDGKNYFLSDLGDPKNPVNLSSLFASLVQNSTSSSPVETPIKFFFHPFSNGKIIVIAKNSAYSLDLKRNVLNKIISAKNIIASAASDNEIFIEDAKGNLYSYNLFLQTAGSYDGKFPVNASLKASPGGSFLFFLKDNGELIKYDRAQKTSETLSKSAENFFISPDEKRIIISTKDNRLSMGALSDYYADGDVKKGDVWAIPSGNGELNDFEWLPDSPNYGLVLSGEKLSLTELDSRIPQNNYPVADGVKKLFVQGENIYILKTNGTLSEVSLK